MTELEKLETKKRVVSQIMKFIRDNKMTQTRAAKIIGCANCTITHLVKGSTSGITIAWLEHALHKLTANSKRW